MKKRTMITLLLATLCLVGVVINATIFSPSKINVRFQSLESSKIPSSLDDISIVFFADLHFNGFVDQDRAQMVFDMIDDLNPDVVIFGGDLLDHPSLQPLSTENQAYLINALAQIKAPLGKFAVMGNHDLESPLATELVNTIYADSDFEVLINENVKIHNKTSSFINLIGIDSMALGVPDLDLSYANISPNSYNLVVCHTPDIFDEVSLDLTDLLLAGHSHGGQIFLPLFGPLYLPEGAQKYVRGTYTKEDSTLDVSNGVGTTKEDIRFFAPAEIVHYTLKSLSDEVK